MAIYLIDYENKNNAKGFSSLSESDKVFLFYSKNHNTMTFEQHFDINNSRAKIEIIEADRPDGVSNALDFQLVFFLGTLVKEFPDESFFIISGDKGYTALKKTCNAMGIKFAVINSFEEASKNAKKNSAQSKKNAAAKNAEPPVKEATIVEAASEIIASAATIAPDTEIAPVTATAIEIIPDELTDAVSAVDEGTSDRLTEMLLESGVSLEEKDIKKVKKLLFSVPPRDLLGALKKNLGGDEEKAGKVKAVITKYKRTPEYKKTHKKSKK